MTGLKRHVTTDEESVGGPVDVAVVTKCDGFVWIKRKHYFLQNSILIIFNERSYIKYDKYL